MDRSYSAYHVRLGVLPDAHVGACCGLHRVSGKDDGRREEGSIYATYSLFRKIAQGLGTGLISFAVGLTGYNSKLGATTQAAGVPDKIYFMTGIIPFIGSVICFLSMYFLFTLSDKRELQENSFAE